MCYVLDFEFVTYIKVCKFSDFSTVSEQINNYFIKRCITFIISMIYPVLFREKINKASHFYQEKAERTKKHSIKLSIGKSLSLHSLNNTNKVERIVRKTLAY